MAEERDIAEVVRVSLILAALALNVWIMWDYVKDQPEVVVMRNRLAGWWHQFTASDREAARVKRMENETVFEAIQVVDDAGS